MFPSYYYEFEKCIEKDCTLCPQRVECIHYTPEEEYPPQEEYRMFVAPLDDTSGELLKNVSKKISRLGYPEREVYKLVSAWYLLGYQVRDLLKLISRGMHPLEIETIVFELIRDEFRVYLSELAEHGLLSEEKAEVEVDVDNPQWGEFLALLRIKNFTGEVRLGPPEEEPQEESISPGVQNQKMIDEALKWATSIKYAKNGRFAYQFSEKCKSIINNLPPDWAEVVKKQLKKAWEDWKSSHAKKK